MYRNVAESTKGQDGLIKQKKSDVTWLDKKPTLTSADSE